MRPPAFLGQLADAGQETRRIEFERRQLARHRAVELFRCLEPRGGQRLGPLAIALARILRRRFERVEFGLAGIDRVEPAAHVAHRAGQVVDLAAMLAGQRAQFEQPRLGRIERFGIVHQRLGRRRQLVLGFARLDHRAVERRQRLGQQRMFGRDPVEPPRRHPQRSERRIRTLPQMPQFLEIARQFLALLHRAARFGQPCFLARLRFERGQLGEMCEQQVLIGLGLFDRRARFGKPSFRRTPALPSRSNLGEIGPREAVEQRPVPARIDQPAIVVLPVQFDQRSGQRAEQRDANRLVVDEGLAAPIGLKLPPDDQRLARFDLDIGLVECFDNGIWQRGELETRGYARPVLARAHQRAVGAVAQYQPERVEQDRLACPGLAGQHAQPAPELQFERLDQHDIADGQAGQHDRPALLAQAARHVTGLSSIANS